MKRSQNCPCGECLPSANHGMRNCPATDLELAQLKRARKLTDPKKIAALMPAWLKSALYKPPKPFVFVPDKKPVYPSLPAGASWKTKAHPADVRPDAFSDRELLAADTTAAYVARWDELNGLRSISL